MSPKVWLITGCSSGFGGLLVRAALKNGDKVIATARDPKKIDDLKALGVATLALDVCEAEENIQKAVADANAVYGRIDILVNNAAYILEGTVEESSAAEVFKIFNTNVFGSLTMARAVLPYMRAQKNGTIANMGSIGGVRGTQGAGLYCSTKFAIAGITDSLRAEVAHLGIDAVCIEPGYFRTNFLAPGHRTPTAARIADYDPVMEPIRNIFNTYDRAQPGDPEKGAQLIVEILTKSGRVAGKEVPVRVPIGSDAIAFISTTAEETLQNMKDWKDLSSSTDHDDVKN
ncbi:NAD(P)-binding protein [Choiromyces venosus 120613-1]|uniref:NAD(P)-binding protein n=1 Tax=Choiromyces venosus 120613-1 TaxID=1336337 RepID=A0A3N4K0M2_9PEZI|nr:NAD(P)-binding protein [Choiromyces venosus 120613-1]